MKQLFLILIILSALLPFVSAEQVCCEKTTTGDYCQYTEQSECAAGSAYAATSCDQTSFCKPGCCYDQNGDGYCYGNYAKATCEQEFNGKFSDDPTCASTLECKEGCCVIGTQAAFVTETKCKSETSKYPDLAMDFRTEITTEAQCLEVARTAEKGACLEEEGQCTYTTRANCKGDFTANKYCSQIPEANCAPANPQFGGQGNAKDTGCLPNEDDVYWIDSCGNPEGIKENCDFSQGSLCGDSEGDERFTCESLNCQEGTADETLSINLQDTQSQTTRNVQQAGVLNGESWCLYDTGNDVNPQGNGDDFADIRYHARDLVGSRYYRSICIAGKEIVEPCADYRAEYCLADQATLQDESTSFTMAGCVENRWQSCISECNTADMLTQESAVYDQNLKNDQACCSDISKRDCSWSGKCVPKVAPGFKFWENEGSDTCEQGSLGCPMLVRCAGWQKIFTGGKCGGPQGWQVMDGNNDGVPDVECLSQDFQQAANNLCRSFGDCGAKYNIEGALSKDGFAITETFGDNFDRALKGDITKFKGQYRAMVLDLDGKQITFEFGSSTHIPGSFEQDPDWEKGTYFLSYRKPEDTRGKWGRFFIGGSEGARRPAGTAVAADDIAELSINIGAAFAMIYFGIAGNTGVYSNTEGQSPLLKTFAGPLISFIGDVKSKTGEATERVNSAKKNENKALQALQMVGGSGLLNQLGKATTTENKVNILEEAKTSVLTSGQQEAVTSAQNALQETAAAKEGLKDAQKSISPKQGTKIGQQAVNIAAWIYMIGRVVDVLFEETQTITVQAQCSAYVAPQVVEEDQCEKCNTDYKDYVDENGKPENMRALKICSEYRCKSLGASCELINEGSENELCVSTSQYDTAAPIIKSWKEGIDPIYQDAVQETQNGYRITQELPIYNNVNIAIETDEPAQCKMSFEHSKRFEDMPDYFFGGAAYDYFHMQTIFFPQATEENALAFSEGGGKYIIYVRCQDAQGNQNENDYSIEVQISQEPDITAPIIETTSLGSDAYLTANASQTPVILFVAEPAECKYSLNNERFENMGESCTTTSTPNSQGTYECHFGDDTANAGPMVEGFSLGPGDTGYAFFKCQDLAGNANKESFVLTLHGTKELNIASIQPTGEIFTSISQQNITLKVITTQGADLNGNAVCRYTDQEALQNDQAAMIPFLNTNSSIHTQPLTLAAGEHTYYVLCADKAGNLAQNQTTMSITADTYAPLLIRSYKITTVTPPVFKIKTNEPAECQYTLDGPFNWGEGNQFVQEPGNLHVAAGDADIYYILCKDNYENLADHTTVSFIY